VAVAIEAVGDAEETGVAVAAGIGVLVGAAVTTGAGVGVGTGSAVGLTAAAMYVLKEKSRFASPCRFVHAEPYSSASPPE
jgi:hypothetical protein